MSDDTDDEDKKPNKGAFQPGHDSRRGRGGAPRRTPDGRSLPAMAREHTELALNRLVEILKDPDERSDVAIKAAKEVLSRGWGQAKVSIEHTGGTVNETTTTIDLQGISQEVIATLLDRSRGTPIIDGQIIGEDDIDFLPAPKRNDDEDGEPVE